MSFETIRPYEMSIWTLQDSFITVLKPIEGLFKGQIIAPKVSLKNDNTQILTFSIPMYYRNRFGEFVENPLWYNTKNGNLLVNLRKIKVIFNKGEEGEGVYEFVIQKVTESHNNGQLICDIEAEGLAFQELGKSGYKITLNYDEFLIDAEKDTNLIASLDYWAAKIFKNTNWTYSIQMDWSSFDGIIDLNNGKVVDYENLREGNEYDEVTSSLSKYSLNKDRENRGLRRRDKVYEEEYISSWSIDEETNKLIPRELVNFKEKARIPQIEKSNRYNASQDLAELFEVFCKYRYTYDKNYHIIGRECIFYNNFLDEKTGKFDINYPYHTNEITRTLESVDVITKMYVVPTDNISIMNVSANKSKEDYILNFDYLYEIGTITQEQYDAIDDYQYNMHILNNDYQNRYDKKTEYDNKLTDLKANYTNLINSINYDSEQITLAEEAIDAIQKGEETLKRTELNPERLIITEEKKTNGESVFKTKISLEGIIENSVKIYLKYDSGHGVSDPIDLSKATPLYDSETNKLLIGYANLPDLKTSTAYLVCDYKPILKYQTIIDTFKKKMIKDEEELDKVEKELTSIGFTYGSEFNQVEGGKYEILVEEINEIQIKLQNSRDEFERMMGPALREGSWQPEEDYSDNGDSYTQFISFKNEAQVNGIIRAFWDTELFENEVKHYYEEGIDIRKIYYPAIDITNVYPKIQAEINKENSTIEEKDLVIHFKISKAEKASDSDIDYYLGIYSQFDYAFLKEDSNTSKIIPVFLITEEFTEKELEALKNAEIGTKKINEDGSIEFTKIDGNFTFINYEAEEDASKIYNIVYPRIEIQSDKLKTSDSEISIFKNENEKLKKYTDYTLLNRENWYYLTIKPRAFIDPNLITKVEEFEILNLDKNSFTFYYILSNADLMVYLDALEVSKTNAYPQASYEVSVSSLREDFVKFIYQKLNKMANINDYGLKFENVQGYISEIDINLDKPDQDSIIIQNYKTKFEDLFSRIVASTEQMKANQFIYDRAAASFTSEGFLNPAVVQGSINQNDLKYSFNQGKLSIDENNGIWATSDAGVVAMRGGGIFCATEKDANNNWLWNTGITPSGINASLLQAGTIDTNLIRIYSGDNIRFQMNADGLFAYQEGTNGETNFNKYVVHNSEGLFLTEKNVEEYEDENGEKQTSVDLVEISWDGLILRNKQGDIVFNADRGTGNLTIAGEINANTGNIGGWTITDGGLEWIEQITNEEDNEINILKKAGIVLDSKAKKPYSMLYVNGSEGSFSVQSDGTLYAKNAYFQGQVAAGSYIANMSTKDAVDAIKRLELINFYGTSFNYTNPNLDGNIVLERDWLSFVCQQIGIKCNTWKIYDITNLDKKVEKLEDLENCALYFSTDNNDKDKIIPNEFLSAEVINDLTFTIKSGIIEPEEYNEQIKLIIVGMAKEFSINEETGIVDTTPGTEEDKNYFYEFIIYNNGKDIDKRISLFDPPSYSFTEPTLFEKAQEDLRIDKILAFNIDGENLEEKFGSEFFSEDNLVKPDYEGVTAFINFLESLKLEERLLVGLDSNIIAKLTEDNYKLSNNIIHSLNNSIKGKKDFILTLTNIKLAEENIFAEEQYRAGIVVLDGNSNEVNSSNGSSSILLPGGSLEVNGQPVEEGNPITGQDYNFDVSYILDENDETKSYLIFSISRDEIPEGEEIYLRYSYEKASRTCNIFRPKNGKNNIITVIKSSEGNVFKNGNINTELSVEVYEGTILINGENTKFGYLWFQGNKPIESLINKKEKIQITEKDIKNKEVYTVQVYETEEEAEAEYNRIIPKNET